MEKITSTLIAGYTRIYGLNGFTLADDTFYKYMPLHRFIESIQNKELVFVSPKTWYDPFESLYYNADCSLHSYTPVDVACMCVTSNRSKNEEAAWRTYIGNDEKAVRVSYDVKVLLDFLEEYAINNSCTIFIGNVNYDFNKDDIKKIGKANGQMHNVYCPSHMETQHYLSLLLLKRKSFKYENEIRIFIAANKANQTILTSDLLRLDFDYSNKKLITKVLLSPYPYEDSKTPLGKFYYNLHDKESKSLKEEISKLLNVKVEQSRLYDRVPTYQIEL